MDTVSVAAPIPTDEDERLEDLYAYEILDSDPEELIDYAARPEVAYDHKASMLQDVEARRQTEVDYLNGGIAGFGKQLGVPTPTHETIWALVKGVEASW